MSRPLAAALAMLALAGCPSANDGVASTEGRPEWSAKQRADWYGGQQGSRLMPLAWLRALERPGGTAPFLADEHIASFRLLPQPGKLPVGFAIDDGDDTRLTVSKLRWFEGQKPTERWAGLNCAACHTAELTYGGKAYRIDGGPSLFDYQSFVEAIDAALKQTRAEPARFDRFARKVLCAGRTARPDGSCDRDGTVNRGKLRDALTALIAWEDEVERINQTESRYGYGRVDAFGHIFNKVSLFTTRIGDVGQPSPNPASAPVSYPFLWDIYRHDLLQWNGIVPSARFPKSGPSIDFGALGRNAGEVIGVFGDVAVTPDPGLKGYASSVKVANLERLERQLTSVPIPRWPAAFPAVDPTEAARGKAVFAEHCVDCHAPRPGTKPYKVTMLRLTPDNPNNTDPWMACNAIRYTSAAGNLVGVREDIVRGDRYPAGPAKIADMLSTVVKGALLGQKGEIVAQAARVFLGVGGSPVAPTEAPGRSVIDDCFDMDSKLFAYKARPLDGIWATAPYLHNGSVPNLAQLLVAPADRISEFYVGTRDYDPDNAGYQTVESATNSFRFDTTLPGNSNAGHDYGVGKLAEADRAALLAYLKTL